MTIRCTARILLAAAATLSAAQAQSVSIIANFNGANGIGPTSLVQGSDGNFYGTTGEGGQIGNGTVFKLTPDGTLTTLHSFSGLPPDGSLPGGLIQAQDGNFYGVTSYGGHNNWGTIFRITSAGEFTTLYTPSGLASDGIDFSGLIQATDGNFYGTAVLGGLSDNGTVFKMTALGTLTTLHSFDGTDGSQPQAGLIQASDGNFYGTTESGGAFGCAGMGCGTIFKVTPSGALTTLYSFGATLTDGASPVAPLIQATDGNFYGTAQDVFKITPEGAFTTLYSFGGDSTDGGVPYAGLLQASDGKLYGTTNYENCPVIKGCGTGTIFSITLAGAPTILYKFPSVANDGLNPSGSLIQAADGNIYGTTSAGGISGNGTVFRLTLPPPDTPAIAASNGVLNGASFQPGISPGSWITINGTNLSPITDTWNNSIVNGALPTTLDGVSVSVGGQPAYIEYVSGTQINAIAPNIPAGSVDVTVTNSNGASEAVNAQLAAETPAFFQWGNYAVATHQDYTYAVKNGTFAGTTTVPAAPGDVIILWGTGFGPTSPSAPAGVETPSTATYNTASSVSVTIGGKPATVYGAALAPGYAGLYQVAIQIPASLANGDYPVVASISGAQSQSTTLITVQQ
jgi:uncharacterized protein (TIGR03437 family)